MGLAELVGFSGATVDNVGGGGGRSRGCEVENCVVDEALTEDSGNARIAVVDDTVVWSAVEEDEVVE